MSIDATDRPNTVEISEEETTVTVVASVGAIGPQGPEGPQGPQGIPGAIASLTVSSPLASTGGSAPTLSLSVVPVTYGGTGVGSLTGYVYGNGTTAFTASTTIPNSAVSGLGTMALQNATSIAVTGGYLTDVSEEVSCVNRTGSNIPVGKAVYIIGAHGDVPEIALADASGESTAARTLGITAEAIADAGTGRVCFSGLLKGVNTNALTEGALVWLSETAGELTTTRPTQPAHGVFMGLCVKQAPGGAGILFVSVVNGQELDELHDVLITSPTAGQLFKRNVGNTLWVNASPASLTATSDTNVTLTLGGNAATALVNDASLTLGWTGTLASSRLNANVVQTVTSDTNVIGSINSQALTLGWSGVLAGTRLNSAVVQSVSSDTNVTGSINSQALTLGWTGQLPVSRGGSGASSLSGYLVGNGGSAFTAVSSIPGSAISGNIAGNAANVTGLVAVTNGGTGVGSLTGLVKGNGTSAFTAATSGVDYAPATSGTAILYGNGAGGFSAVSIGSNLTFTGGTLSATGGGGGGTVTAVTATSPLASSGGATPDISFTGILPVTNGGTGTGSLTGYLVGNGTGAFTAVSSIPGSAISGNITGNAANVTGTVAVGNGGTGATSLTGYLVGNGGSAFTAVSSIPNTAISGLGTMSTQNANNVAITGGTATSLALVTVAAGTVGSPSIAAQNDTLTGLYWPSSATVGVVTNGTERLRVSNSGNVGVNITPSAWLSGYKAIQINRGSLLTADTGNELFFGSNVFSDSSFKYIASSITATQYYQLNGAHFWRSAGAGIANNAISWTNQLQLTAAGDVAIASGAKLLIDGVAATGNTYLIESSADNLSAFTGGTERLRLTSGGDVAIAATAKLYLDGVAATGNTYLQEVSADTLVAVTNGTERLRIGSTGNVSIGVNSPAALLEMAGDSVTEFRQTRYTTGVAGPANTLRKARGTQNSPTAVAAGDSLGILSFIGYGGTNFSTLATVQGVVTDYTSDTNMTAHLRFLTAAASTTAVEQMRITGTGVVAVGAGWGTTSPAGNVLQGPNGSGTNVPGGNLTIGGGNGTGTGGSGAILFQTAPAGSSGTTANTMAERMRIDNVGNVGVGTSTFGSSAANVFAVATGTEPTSGPADTVQIFSVDRSAGNTIPGIRCEGTGVTDAGITSTAVTHKIAMKVNGTVYYLLATTNAT